MKSLPIPGPPPLKEKGKSEKAEAGGGRVWRERKGSVGPEGKEGRREGTRSTEHGSAAPPRILSTDCTDKIDQAVLADLVRLQVHLYGGMCAAGEHAFLR